MYTNVSRFNIFLKNLNNSKPQKLRFFKINNDLNAYTNNGVIYKDTDFQGVN